MNTNNGWKLVPIEPTDEMETAAEDDYEQTGATFPRWKSAYAAMLAAAPTPPASAQDDAKDERQAFEVWADNEGFPLDCDFFEVSGQYYDHPDTQLAYNIWRAARASVAAPAAGDARDAAVGAAIGRACAELPCGYIIELNVEAGYAGACLFDPDGNETDLDHDERDLASELNDGINAAISASQQQEG